MSDFKFEFRHGETMQTAAERVHREAVEATRKEYRSVPSPTAQVTAVKEAEPLLSLSAIIEMFEEGAECGHGADDCRKCGKSYCADTGGCDAGCACDDVLYYLRQLQRLAESVAGATAPSESLSGEVHNA